VRALHIDARFASLELGLVDGIEVDLHTTWPVVPAGGLEARIEAGATP
jgi:hypothetical protein